MTVKKVLFDMVMGAEIKEEKLKETVSDGGIIISTTPEEDSPQIKVKVIHVGKGVEEIKVDDIVLIQPYGNNKIKLNSNEVYIFRENVAICILNE